MKTISIVGFGRFGQTLYRLLKDDFKIILYNRNSKRFDEVVLSKNTVIAKHIADVYKSEVVFFAVPIATFESVIQNHKKYFKNHLLIDVLSVKMHAKKVFQKYLRNTGCQALLTHPMFGPDSSKNGFAGLPIVIDSSLTSPQVFQYWKEYFSKKGLRVIEMSTEEHDKFAAQSQGVTHFIGRLLQEFEFKKTPIDTLGAKKLHEVMEQTCNDSWELFSNLQTYNPYTKRMRTKLEKAFNKLIKILSNGGSILFSYCILLYISL